MANVFPTVIRIGPGGRGGTVVDASNGRRYPNQHTYCQWYPTKKAAAAGAARLVLRGWRA